MVNSKGPFFSYSILMTEVRHVHPVRTRRLWDTPKNNVFRPIGE